MRKIIRTEFLSKELPLFLVFAVVIFISFYCFTVTPASWLDEGIFFQAAKNIAFGNYWGIQRSPGSYEDLSLITMGYPALLPAAAALKIFGPTIIVLRLVAIAFLVGFSIVFYFLLRRLYGEKIAGWGTLFLGTFSPLYGNGKVFLAEVPGLFYFALGLLFLVYFEKMKTKGVVWGLLAGFALGLAVATKPNYILILPAIGLACLFHAREFFLTRRGRSTMILGFLGFVVAITFWFLTQFSGAISVSRIFAHYSNPYYINNFWPLILSNLRRFVTETTPAHFLILFAIGFWFLFRKFRKKEIISVAELTVFFFAIGIIIFYVRTAGWYRYFFPGHAMLFLFLAPGLATMVRSILGSFGDIHQKVFFLVLPVLIVGIQFVPLQQEALRCSIDPATELEPYSNSLIPSEKVFFYNVPHLAARFTRNDFYQYVWFSDHFIVGKENETLLAQGFFSTVFVPQNAKMEIKKIPQCYKLDQNIRKILVYKRIQKACQ